MHARFNHILMAAALGGLINTACAQTPPATELKLAESGMDSPYVTDSQRFVVRNSTGLCWRTGYWTAELAASVKVEGRDKPIGCYCDEGVLPKAVCSPPPPPVAEVTAPALVVPPAPMAKAEKVTINADTLFVFDRSELTLKGKEALDDFVGKLKGMNLEAIVAIGHTDRIGTPAYNTKLSESRAASVKGYLTDKGGIAKERVFTEGRGESQPITKDCVNMGREAGANKKLVACLQPDRRVDIEAVGSR